MRCGSKDASARRSCGDWRVMVARRALDEPRLDQLFAEPIVRQLMRRDRIDEATIRRLLRLAAAARPAPSAPPKKGLLGVTVGSRHPLCLGWCSTDHETTQGRSGHSPRGVLSRHRAVLLLIPDIAAPKADIRSWRPFSPQISSLSVNDDCRFVVEYLRERLAITGCCTR